MSWTRNGTVSVTNGSAIVYGAGTTWASGGKVRAGDAFKAPDGRDYEVLSVQSNTQLTLTSPYLGTTASAQAYAIINTGLLPAELAVAISDLQSKYLMTISQLYDWETSTAATVPLTNPATQVTAQVKPISGLIADLGSKASAANPTFSGNVGVGVPPSISNNRMTVLGTGAFSPTADNSTNGVGVCVLGNDLATVDRAAARFFLTGNNVAHAGCMELRSGNVNTSTAKLYNTAGAVGLEMDANGVVLSRGGGGIGYGNGAGGSVTQATSPSTEVALSKPVGRIVLAPGAIPIGGTRTFYFRNSHIELMDGLIINTADLSQGDPGDGWDVRSRIAGGLAVITLTNISGSTALSYFGLNYHVIKGAAA